MRRPLPSPASLCLLAACAGPPRSTPPAAPGPPPAAELSPREARFLADLQQLTFGGENAEAYFSFDGRALSMQARAPGQDCDRIYRMPLDTRVRVPVSSGAGATTCAHFFPDGRLLYASTHLAGAACPPRPDMRAGYVWALHDSYDIFATSDASGRGELRRLTAEKGYDAEATVCGKDGSIVFTSTRDGDIELYRMDADGQNVRRLTHTPGYDGGAFFSADCTRIVWRASRPRPGPELDEYRALLARGLVRPSKLELWIANADGSEPMQLTYLDAAAFAPFLHPTEPLVLFSSNHGSAGAREFDLWAIGLDGTGLTRVTDTPGFDGFPHVSPDGKWLAFSSNRATAPGASDTNVFLARWRPGMLLQAMRREADHDADRIARDIRWLADPAREGRGAGTHGLEAAGEYLEARLRELGLEGGAADGGFREPFEMITGVTVGPATELVLAGRAVPRDALTALGTSAQGRAAGNLVLAGYGIVDEKSGLDDYRGVQVTGKIVVVRRFAPEGAAFADTETKRRLGDLRRKAWLARQRGAVGLIVVDWPLPPSPPQPDWQAPAEAPLPDPGPPGGEDAGLPVIVVKRAALEGVWPRLQAGKPVPATLNVALTYQTERAFNVLARVRAAGRARSGKQIVLGAHYDHLGFSHHGSLAPEAREPHVGADDNASGTATLLELARSLSSKRRELRHDILLALFSGEEWGLLGSSHHVRARGAALSEEVIAMVNLDMVGRLRGNLVQVLGADTAQEWRALLEPACAAARVGCDASGDGYGPSDQAAFYPAGVPVLHFFTGSHGDYHKPSDTADRINAAGAAAIARVVTEVVRRLDGLGAPLTFRKVSAPQPGGDLRSFNASLGSIPDYAGPPGGQKGVLLSGVRPGSAADLAGMRRGDILVRLGKFDVLGVHDLMYALNGSKPGETVGATVLREGKRVELTVTFQEARPQKSH